MTEPPTGPMTEPSAEPPTEPPLRVVIADDQALVRTGFGMILAADGIDVVAEAADGDQAVEAVHRTRPDLVLMDIRMPGTDGLEATRRILSGAVPDPPPRVVMLTTFDLDRYVYAALTAGASGFLLKDVTPEHLVAAVRLTRLRRRAALSRDHPPPGRTLCRPRLRYGRPAPRPLGPHPTGAGGPPGPRRRSQQRGTRRPLPPQRGDREDPCGPHPRQTPPPGPCAGGRRRLRDRPGRAPLGEGDAGL